MALFLRRKQQWAIAALLCCAMIYAGLAFSLSSFHAFWSPDCGARFAMIRNWLEHGQLIYINYPEAEYDPSRLIHPLVFFLFRGTHGTCVMYPPLFPFLSGLAYRAFGFRGLALLPLLCGIGTILITDKTAKLLGLRFRPLLMLSLGLATPLILYSVIFWDHSAQMFLAGMAAYWLLRAVQGCSFHAAVLAGGMLGTGVWIHELFLALFVAVWLAALPFLKQRSYIPLGLLAGFIPVVLAWGTFNLWAYGVIGGPHLGANVVQNNLDHPFTLASVFDFPQLAERAMFQLTGSMIAVSQDDLLPYYLVFACLLIIYVFVAWVGRPLLRAALLMSFIIAAWSLLLLLKKQGVLNGLFQATPLLIPALAVPWYVPRNQAQSSPTEVFYAWLSRACWLFILFLLINPMFPGVDWGSRYLLVTLPLLVLLASHALEQQAWQMNRRWRVLVVFNAVALVSISLACQITGVLWVRRCLAYGQELNTQVRAISSPILVTDTDINARLVDAPLSQVRFCVRRDDGAKAFALVLRQCKYKEIIFVGSEDHEPEVEYALAEAGQPFVKSEDRLLWKVDRPSQEGDDLQFVRFVVTLRGSVQGGRRKP